MYYREGKLIFPYLSEFFAETSVIKDRLTKEKQTRLLICILHVYIRDTQEKWVTQRCGFRI